MKINRIILALTLIAMSTNKLARAATQPHSRIIEKSKLMYKTFRDDMSCVFNPQKKCTRKQKIRITAEAASLIAILATLTTGAVIKEAQAKYHTTRP